MGKDAFCLGLSALKKVRICITTEILGTVLCRSQEVISLDSLESRLLKEYSPCTPHPVTAALLFSFLERNCHHTVALTRATRATHQARLLTQAYGACGMIGTGRPGCGSLDHKAAPCPPVSRDTKSTCLEVPLNL